MKRWGIFAEEFGAVPANRVQERHYSGEIIKDIDIRGPNAMWQHPWLLSHRVNLHEKLKALSTAEDGVGTPVKLYTSSKIESLDPEKGEAHLADGTVVTGDVLLGADGIYVSVSPASPPPSSTVQNHSKERETKETRGFLVTVQNLHQRHQIIWFGKGCLSIPYTAGKGPR